MCLELGEPRGGVTEIELGLDHSRAGLAEGTI